MKTIGLIGGITWLSTIDYYRLINQMINEKIGGVSSAKILMSSVEFGEIKRLTESNDWDGLAAIISDAAQKLETAGADCILICANTMHKIADKIQSVIKIPLIHIAEETAKAVTQLQLQKVALLGTKYTMQLDFYKNKLAEKNIESIIPDTEDADYINDAIYNEMGKGIFLPERKKVFLRIINELITQGAKGIILGCTEIPILIKQNDVAVPVFDTTAIHTKAAVEFALK
ncbi:aspartate/glutamate racemase family protein [Panacibacter ginsenosidivorans]|uniref:Aspartate/glutamate racemase family protein n=1 Tax=Panacibacter ginsenosidivorans TaxID=1813871 RepID=A0A5B8V6S4_9BACT|nr:aspartate/glutamate racemase family protein [Panacibacter ginsenosidivorans]QEC66919.1 aspartate/glutamate racemase family protein [Panacibacter ginsenosidivorans]